MNKKFIPGLIVAIVAVGFAVFVAAYNVNNKSSDKQVKGASTAQTTKKTESTANTESKADESASDSSNDTPASTGVPADQNSNNVLAIVTKPVATTPAPADQVATTGGSGGGDTTVTPAPTPDPTPTPTPTPPVVPPTPPVTPSTPPVVTDGNLVPNPSVEDNTAGQPNGWTSSFYGTITATPSYVATGHTGAHALTMAVSGATAGAAGANGAQWNSTAFNVTAGSTYTYSDFFISDVASEVDITYMINGVATPYYGGVFDASAAWKQSSVTQAAPAGATQAYISHIITTNGTLTTDDYAATSGVSVGTGFTNAMVTLTFDDAWESIYANALPLLRSYGIHSTQYLLTGIFDLPDYMTQAQMADLATTEEVADHTVDHCDFSGLSHADEEGYSANCAVGTIPQSEYDFQLGQSKATLQTITGQTVTNFASPYGANAPVAQLQANGLTSQRGVQAGYNSPANFNQNNILVQNILSTTTPAEVQGWIDNAIASHTWLVIVYHEVGTSEDTTYSTSTANLDANLSYLKTKVDAGQVQALTVRDALAAIHAQGL